VRARARRPAIPFHPGRARSAAVLASVASVTDRGSRSPTSGECRRVSQLIASAGDCGGDRLPGGGGRARHLAAPRLFPRVHEARDINYSAVAERRPRAKPGCRPEGRRSREELRPRRPTADQHPRGRGGGGTRATSRLRFLLESNGASMGRRFYFASLASRLLPRSTILSRTRACYGGVIRRFCTSPLTLPAFRAFLGERSTNLDSRE